MKKSKFTGGQIAFALRQGEVGTQVAEVRPSRGRFPMCHGPELISRALDHWT